jgi:adenylate kinase
MTPPPRDRTAALLLLGPTGSGKTPLGGLLERKGLAGVRCVHFDFGAGLRAAAAAPAARSGLGPHELEIVRQSLRTGAVLENEHFPIARKILRAFLRRAGVGPRDLLVLNGLPRHEKQAEAMDTVADIRAVIELRCCAETARRRIGGNIAGDRTARPDDSAEAITRRMEIFRARTAPMIEWYRKRGTPLLTIDVDDTTDAEKMYTQVCSFLSGTQRQTRDGEEEG